MKIGIFAANLRMETRGSIITSAKLGAEGVQLWNSSGPLTPWELGKTARADLLHLIKSNGLVVSALCGDFGHGFTNPANVEEIIEKTKQVVDMAPDLETNVITTHIGLIPEDPNHVAWKTMAEALEEVGKYAEDKGCLLATETGPEEPALMVKFLSTLKTSAITVNYDPANLAMNGYHPIAGVETLKDYIVHTHAKDGLRHPDGRPEEKPLGEGAVGLPDYIAALRSIGFDGFVVIERESGEDREGDMRRGVEYLRTLM